MAEQHPTTSEEIWKPIPGFPGYEVSDHGRVRSHFSGSLKILKINKDSGGYCYAALHLNGKRHNKSVHKLILLTFVGPCPPGYQGCHKDDIRTNNHLYNLRWDTRSGNYHDRRKLGTDSIGERNGRAKVSEEQVRQIRLLFSQGHSQAFITRKLSLSEDIVHKIVHRKRWKHVR